MEEMGKKEQINNDENSANHDGDAGDRQSSGEKCECRSKKNEPAGESDEETGREQKKIVDLENEISVLRDTLLRKMAESENLRKRLEKERDDAEKFANGRFAKDLLGVLDNFDRIMSNSNVLGEKIKNDEKLKAFFDGIDLCGKELVSAFKKHGISTIAVAKGDAFDPKYHQAMCEVEDENHKSGSVIEVFQAGYLYNDRLLRPAMVSVSKKK
jgi:molecular chaperone GrpE